MNFFFTLSSNDYDYKLTIPRFTNSGKILSKLNLYTLGITRKNFKNIWNYKILQSNDEMFYTVKNNPENLGNFYFLGTENICKDLFNEDKTEIKIIKNFLETRPPYRSNTSIKKKNYGSSSYQSDYPNSMVNKNGSIVSPLKTLLNKDACINKIFFINLYYKPVVNKFRYYLVNYKLKKVIYSDEICTNAINEININKDHIKNDIFFVTKNYIGIPIFFSDQMGHLSLEHTHPPHEYIFGQNKYKIISDYKSKFNEIIDKENL